MNHTTAKSTLSSNLQQNQIKPLPVGTLVHNQYKIVHVLSKGSFSWVYLAQDLRSLKKNNKTIVVIKEYAPDGFSERNNPNNQTHWIKPLTSHSVEFQAGLEIFFSEIHALCSLRSNYIANVLDAFTWSDNAYFVMEYCEGITLEQKITQSIKQKSHFNQPIISLFTLLRFARSLTEVLRQIHTTGWLHLDIKPANLYIRRDGNAMLLDLGSARHELKQRAPHKGITYTPRFAPPELRDHQTLNTSNIGPWSDVYSFAACLYQMICGQAPPLKGVDAPSFEQQLTHNLELLHADQSITKRLQTLITESMLQNPMQRTASFFTIERQIADIDELLLKTQLTSNPVSATKNNLISFF
jgi:serine/threonine protein kinase